VPLIDRRFRSLFVFLVVGFAMFGGSVTLVGATLPKIIADFGWSYVATGLVLSAGALGYVLSAFCSGVLLQRLGPKRVIVAGLLLQSVGLALFVGTPLVVLNLVLHAVIGVGQGGLEVVVNFSAARMERGGQSRVMNLMHAAFCVGAVLSATAVAVLLGLGLRWQASYRWMALIALLAAGATALLPFDRLRPPEAERAARPRVARVLRQPLLVLSFLMLWCYVGSELGVSAWVSEYYVKILGTPARAGACMVAVFWLGLLVGRLVVAGYHGRRQAELVLALASGSTVALALAMRAAGPWTAGAGFFVAGLGYSAIYPLVMALVGGHARAGQEVAVGFATMGGGIGSFATPFLMAAVSQQFGLRAGFGLYLGLNALMILLACLMIRQVRRGAHQPPVELAASSE